MASTNFNFNGTESIISYDLEDNDVSAQEIADARDGKLKTYIPMSAGKQYHLPNTTLYCSLGRDNAKTTFISAFNATYSESKISRLFITEVGSKIAYIQDES